MADSALEKLRLLEQMLDTIPAALTYVDSEGKVLYFNRVAGERPSSLKRTVGMSFWDCHSEKSKKSLQRIFDDFKKGRREPHYYVGHPAGGRELATIIPVFEGDRFVGCIGMGHTLEYRGPEKTWE